MSKTRDILNIGERLHLQHDVMTWIMTLQSAAQIITEQGTRISPTMVSWLDKVNSVKDQLNTMPNMGKMLFDDEPDMESKVPTYAADLLKLVDQLMKLQQDAQQILLPLSDEGRKDLHDMFFKTVGPANLKAYLETESYMHCDFDEFRKTWIPS